MYHFQARLALITGILLGVLAALLLHQKNHPCKRLNITLHYSIEEKWIKNKGYNISKPSLDYLRYANATNYTLLSDELFNEVPVLCVIMIKENGTAKPALDTWAKKCNKVYTITFPGTKVPMPMKRKVESSNWAVYCRGILDMPDDLDWIIFVDLPTFVIMENLRLFLGTRNSTDNYYLGHTVTFWNVKYNKRKAGVVLSRAALLALKAWLNGSCDAEISFLNRDDFYLGKTLAHLNIFPEDTRDEHGLSRFHLYSWYHEFFPGLNYHANSVYPVNCCSPRAITFQAIEGPKLYKYYFLLYHLQVFSSGKLGNKLAPQPEEEVWRSFLQQRGVYHDVTKEEYYRMWENVVQDPLVFGSQFKPDSSD